MWDLLLRIAFYLAAGFVLTVSAVWYVRSVYRAVTGTGEVVIVPFAVVGATEDKDAASGLALARMLQSRLQQIESDLAASQRELMEETEAARAVTPPEPNQIATRTAVLPRIFVQGASLETRLLEPAQINVTVGGVDVGGVVPWLQRVLTNRRSLEFSFYDGEKKVSVAGSLQVLGMSGEGLRVDLEKSADAKPDWDDVTTEVAYELIRRRLAREPTNRVEFLSRIQFRTLVEVMHKVVILNRSAATGRPVRSDFAAELTKIEPLVREAPQWHELMTLAASIAESADDKVKALDFYKKVREAIKTSLETAENKARPELQQALNRTTAKITELEGRIQVTVASTENNAIEKIRAHATAAAEAYNKIFGLELAPPPVVLLPRSEPNAYFDGKSFNAPPQVALLPDITHHDVAWQYLGKYIPIIGKDIGHQAEGILYSYSDILPMLLKQKGLAGWTASPEWTLYAGGVAWIKGGDEKAIAADPRPMRSFVSPGNAYDDREVGKDPQIANLKQLTDTTIPQLACGIGNKAFYETAQRLGLDRAWQIWFEALKQVEKEKRVTYQAWGHALLTVAGDDREKLLEALTQVGLDTNAISVEKRTKK